MKFNNHSGTYYVYDFPSIKKYIDKENNNIINKFNIQFHLANTDNSDYDIYKLADMDYFYAYISENTNVVQSSCTVTSSNSFMNMIG